VFERGIVITYLNNKDLHLSLMSYK
jgi:hypothetical protein